MGSLLNPSFALVPAKILAAENSTVAILLPFYQPVLGRITLRRIVADLSSACPLFNPEFEGLYYGFNEVGSKNEPTLQLTPRGRDLIPALGTVLTARIDYSQQKRAIQARSLNHWIDLNKNCGSIGIFIF